jgi:hypothetical protein
MSEPTLDVSFFTSFRMTRRSYVASVRHFRDFE